MPLSLLKNRKQRAFPPRPLPHPVLRVWEGCPEPQAKVSYSNLIFHHIEDRIWVKAGAQRTNEIWPVEQPFLIPRGNSL